MKPTVRHAQRYRARGARRSGRFWWQPLALTGLIVPLWGALFSEARLNGARAFPPPPEPRAAYVVMAPGEAAKALAGMRAAWRVTEGERRTTQLDMGMFDLRDEPAPPAFLEQGAIYPGVWRPAEILQIPPHMPDISVSALSGAEAGALPVPARQRRGLVAAYSKSLEDAGFSAAFPDAGLPELAGECRFHIETDEAGAVAHVLLLSPASAASGILERALARGNAKGAARGVVTLLWSFPK